MTNGTVGMKTRLAGDLASVETRVTEALKAQGFGVLTQIDVQSTLKQKIGVDFRPYKIWGACNPHLAHRALSLAPEIGLLLPCNVTLSEVEPNVIEVAIVDPLLMMDMVQYEGLEAVATEAQLKLDAVIRALEAS